MPPSESGFSTPKRLLVTVDAFPTENAIAKSSVLAFPVAS
jgi:hypothetical protein